MDMHKVQFFLHEIWLSPIAEAMYEYSTQHADYIISCTQENFKVIANFCYLHALEYRNMWNKSDLNYESDMTKDMKALVAAIKVEENGFYMAPGKLPKQLRLNHQYGKRNQQLLEIARPHQ